MVCPQRKRPLLSLWKAKWEFPGARGLRDQLLRGVDDLQDFCGDVAERNSRILLFGPITGGDRRQEQHINNDREILQCHGAHHEIASAVTHANINAPKGRGGERSTQQAGSSEGACFDLAQLLCLPPNYLRFSGREGGELKRKLLCPLPAAESFTSISSFSG